MAALAVALGVGVALVQPAAGQRPTAPAVAPGAVAPDTDASVQSPVRSAPRPLQIEDYALWRSIDGAAISPTGTWVGWSYSRVRGDDTLHLRTVDGATERTVPYATSPRFSDDGRWVAYEIGAPFRPGRGGGEPSTSAGLMELASGERWEWERADAFGFAPGASHFWVKKDAPDGDAEHEGTDVVLRALGDGAVELLGSVRELAFDGEGRWLAYTVDAAERAGNGLYLVDLREGTRRVLDQGDDARYTRLTWADDVAAVAALRGVDADSLVERENTLVTVTGLGSSPMVRTFGPGAGLAAGWVLSEKGGLSWNDSGTVVLVGARPQERELDAWPDTALPLADVNIYHWADDRIQSQQEQSAARDRNRTWRAAAHLESGALTPLEADRRQLQGVTPDGRWAIGRDDSRYISDWQPLWADFTRIDTRTGEAQPIAEQVERAYGLSPSGRHWLYWQGGQFHAHDLERGETVALAADAPASFVDSEWDRFGDPPPWGIAGYTTDGEAVLLYDEHDLWRQPLDGSAPTNLTGGWGAERDVRLRIHRLDPDEETIDLRRPVLLRAFGKRTKQDGFVRLDGDRVEALVLDDLRFGNPIRADDADRILITRQDWTTFPDLWVTDTDFADFTRITEANPQQSEFLWGHRILFDYQLEDGTPLQGTLAIPEGWEPGQRLPMIVRFYEQYSQDLHAHPTPAYRHQPNFAGYVSRGYLLMQPDIHFRTRTTHTDMLESVEAATQAVIDLGYADPDAVGLSGHSYSGGGGAYIAARSKMFAAVAHGAAPINLVSEFNQLFVGAGQNNHRYDIHGQGRYGTNPYDDFELYWEQSPIAWVETMDTPVLYLHGEADPTVNWEQGLEWYNALRFLGKPVIWLSYPDEGHGLARIENRIDFQKRLAQFFGHHLRGEAAPDWMTEGVDYLDKQTHMRQLAPAPGSIPWGGGGR